MAYSIVANTSQLTGGVTASRAEIRALKSAFEESRTPVQRYSSQIAALEALQRKFPASAASLQRSIDQTRQKMADAERPTSLFRTALSRLPIVVDPVSAAFQALRAGADLARQGFQLLLDLSRRVGDQMKKLDETAKGARLLGITEEALVGLRRAAADIAGVDASNFDTGFIQFTRRIAEAAMDGTGEASDALKRLGLSAQELSGMTPDAAFLRTAEAIKSVQNPAERLQLAYDLMGRQGAEMATLLAAGDVEIRRLIDDANMLQQTEFIDHAGIERANDALGRMGEAVEGVFNLLASDFAPLVEQISNDLTRGFSDAANEGNKLRDVISGIANTVHFLVEDLKVLSSFADSGVGRSIIGALPGGDAANTALDAMRGTVDLLAQAGSAQRPTEFKLTGSVSEIAANQEAELKRIAKVNEEIRQLELEAERSVAREQEKRDAARLKALEEQAKAVERLRNAQMAEAERLTESLKTPNELLTDQLNKLLEIKGAGRITDETFVRGLEDLRGKAEELAAAGREAAFTGPRSVGAIQAGSIEALRAQFEPRSIEEKMLKTEEKSLEESKKATSLLTEISGRLAAAVVKEAP